jgi:hypothetical protein
MKDEMKEGIQHRHPLVFIAFILSLIVFVLPTHADLMFSAITARRPGAMAMATLVCFGLVLIPLITGSLLTRRHPQRWRKSRLSVATWVISGLALLFNCFGWWTIATRKAEANQAVVGTSLHAAPQR